MKQLTQRLRSGQLTVQDVPGPQVARGTLLVRNHYSVVSPGTEASTVRTARASLLEKARERPQQVAQVVDLLAKQGPVQTYHAVMKRLEAYSPLGYSCAGEVIAVGTDVDGFAVGDWAACAGVGYANHAEVVTAPQNLCVKLPGGADLKRAAYNTLGAIALQGIRQADLRLGETCAVIGLGLIGQLTCLMLRSSGVRVIGVDVESAVVDTASEHCADLALVRSAPGIADTCAGFSRGLGVDAVIVTAGTASLDPINFAGEIARKRGRVVVVGAVPTGFERDPYYYRKELDLRMSCSYGPGRYDSTYEERGVDYPAAYVRWTEKRNMEAFQELLHSGRIDIDYLTTHEVSLEDAPKAYDMIVNRSEPFLGVVIRYDATKPLQEVPVSIRPSRPAETVGLAFIGAGSYAQGSLLPNLPARSPAVARRGVMTQTGTTSKRVAERFGFEFCTSHERDILANESINTVFVATRHDSHARYVVSALNAGKHVFVEKPLALTESELQSVEAAFAEAAARDPRRLMVGFNRRFAPLVGKLKRCIAAGPLAMVYRVNAGAIPADSWIQDPSVGGGRIVGEACHFIDLMTYLCGALPRRVYATALDGTGPHDTVNISVDYSDGSVGCVAYHANGSKALYKEHVEVNWAGCSAVLRDFKRLEIYTRRRSVSSTLVPDKGQKEMLRRFLDAVANGGPPVIDTAALFAVTRATFRAVDSLRERRPFDV